MQYVALCWPWISKGDRAESIKATKHVLQSIQLQQLNLSMTALPWLLVYPSDRSECSVVPLQSFCRLVVAAACPLF